MGGAGGVWEEEEEGRGRRNTISRPPITQSN